MPLVRPRELPRVVPDVSLSLVPDVRDVPSVVDSDVPRELPSVSECGPLSDVPSDVDVDELWLLLLEVLLLK